MKREVEYVFVFETMHEKFTGFKDISGVVRRKEPQKGLQYWLWDFSRSDQPNAIFADRIVEGQTLVGDTYLIRFNSIRQHSVDTEDGLQSLIAARLPMEQEGWIIRSHDAVFKPGARHWDYQKVVKEPTIDLKIIAFEEGQGKNSGAVGRLIAEYKGQRIGIGPGKLSYTERRDMWRGYGNSPVARIATIKYKPDEGYTALRQPTFQYWREDKELADA